MKMTWYGLLRLLPRLLMTFGVGALVGLPFYWMVISALKTPVEVVAYPPTWIPASIRWANAGDAVALLTARAFVNPVIFATTVTALQLVLVITSGFALAKMPFPGRNALLWMFILTLFVPFHVVLIPTFLIIRQLNWIDTWPAGAASGGADQLWGLCIPPVLCRHVRRVAGCGTH